MTSPARPIDAIERATPGNALMIGNEREPVSTETMRERGEEPDVEIIETVTPRTITPLALSPEEWQHWYEELHRLRNLYQGAQHETAVAQFEGAIKLYRSGERSQELYDFVKGETHEGNAYVSQDEREEAQNAHIRAETEAEVARKADFDAQLRQKAATPAADEPKTQTAPRALTVHNVDKTKPFARFTVTVDGKPQPLAVAYDLEEGWVDVLHTDKFNAQKANMKEGDTEPPFELLRIRSDDINVKFFGIK